MSALLALAVLALGWLALGLLRAKLRPAERWPAAFALGTPLLAAFVLLLVKLHQYRRGVLVWSAIALVLLAIWRFRAIPLEQPSPALSRPWLASCATVLIAVMAWNAYQALGPDTTPPDQDAAFAAAAQIHRGQRKPAWNATALWSAAFQLQRHPGVPLFHSIYLPALALVLLALLRRLVPPSAAVLASLLLATAPAYGTFATQAGTQLLWLFCLFSALWLTVLAFQSRQARLILPALLLALFTARLTPASGTASGGYVLGWFPWLAALPLIALLAWALQRQAAWLAALLAFQCAANVPPLSPRPLPTNLSTSYLIDATTPPTALVFSELPVARAWTTRRVTADPVLHRILQTSWDETLRPNHRRRLLVTDALRRRFFIEHAGLIAEVRFFLKGVELPRTPAWRVRSLEGEPAATQAFDNSFVTGCDCAIEIDFGAPVKLDEVWIDGTQGKFIGAPQGLRRAAIIELQRRGVTHILAGEGSELLGELSLNAKYWGVREVGGRDAAHVFILE